ncbi:non-hydrolyzing UDP-N-acetylglucosamine 2-epimerase [Roseateles koreensis]
MKIAPLVRALRADGRLSWKLVHTGQHYDRNMNEVFFEELGIPAPDVRLACGGGTHAEQTGKIMVAYEALCAGEKPAACLVVGDVNSTLACAIVAKKAGIPVAHVEAGLRSGDLQMPEEINRLVTDAITDWFFVTEPSAVEHLTREGKDPARIFHVGHVMADNVLYQAEKLKQIDTSGLDSDTFKRQMAALAHPGPARYGVVTLHRPSNVDNAESLSRIASILRSVSQALPLAFPVHPRTRGHLEQFGIDLGPRVTLMTPQAYMSFLHLWKDAEVILTDSGGLQEESTALGIPCVTLRDNTERPITVAQGSNTLAGTDPQVVTPLVLALIRDGGKRGQRPALWDGNAANRIAGILADRVLAAQSS